MGQVHCKSGVNPWFPTAFPLNHSGPLWEAAADRSFAKEAAHPRRSQQQRTGFGKAPS